MAKNKKLKIILLFSIFSFIFPVSSVKAAILYLEPASGQYHSGDTFITTIRIDTEKECINTVEANLKFSQDILEAVDSSQAKSIISLWVKSPVIDQKSGLISFSGGIPGGYCGIIPGDPGKTNILGEVIFKVPDSLNENKMAEINILSNSQVLLNDGLGTPAQTKNRGAVLNLLSEKTEAPKREWEEKVSKDNILPEPFQTEVNRNPAIFGGEYFITFSTTDKQTGIDYYQVKEGERDWKQASSPYLLEDQKLKSIIEVRAVDKAGNKRIAEYTPPKKPIHFWIIILILLVGVMSLWFIKKYRRQ